MGYTTDDFSYKNLIQAFFNDNDQLIGQHKKRVDKCVKFVVEKLPPLSVRARESITKSIKSVELTFMKRWRHSKYVDLDSFERDNEKWVHTTLQLPSSVTSGKKGWSQQKKNFVELSERQKNRRVGDMLEKDIGQLLLASAKAAKNINQKDLERVLRILSKDHQIATKILSLLKDEKSSNKPRNISPLQGLTYLLDSNLSKAQYINTKLLSKEHGANIFPAYNKILETKKECRPPAIYMMVNDVSATLPLQRLLDHTVNRLLLLQEEVLATLQNVDDNGIKLKLQVKWGVDGSSGHSQYNQKYLTESSQNSDANLFAATMVPLRITTVEDPIKIIWNNLTPQSSRWCRPIRLHFAKETENFTINEIQSVQHEMKALIPFVTSIAGTTITVSYELYLTMIDGKVLAVVTNTSSHQRCCICKATPKEFNNLKNIEIRFKPDRDALNYGLSVLHLWIRCFEWLLHVSYRKDIGKWQLRGSALKEQARIRKELLQKRFAKRMNLRVDFPSPGGNGNTNSGNVCRTAFANPKVLSEILELDEELVNRIRIMLIALSCQLPIEADLFGEFCRQTAFLYVKKYWWFPLPPTVHKALIHSRDILLAVDLPVGVLAEDAAESCHKFYRNNRLFHARKNSRQNNLMDVFNRALDSSDPMVSSCRAQKRQNSRMKKKLPAEVLCLLRPPDAPATIEEELEETEEDNLTDSNALDDILEEVANFDEFNLPEDPFYNSDNDDSENDEEYED